MTAILVVVTVPGDLGFKVSSFRGNGRKLV